MVSPSERFEQAVHDAATVERRMQATLLAKLDRTRLALRALCILPYGHGWWQCLCCNGVWNSDTPEVHKDCPADLTDTDV